MTKIDMSKLTGLHRRNGVFQLRTLIPDDVQAAYSGREKIIRSLGTSDCREANLRGIQERARMLVEFDRKRLELHPQRLDSVTLELAAELAQRIRATVLHDDEGARDDPGIRVALDELQSLSRPPSYSALTIRKGTQAQRPAPADPLAGLTASQAATLAALNDIRNTNSAVNLAQRNRAAVLPLVIAEARKLGFAFDPAVPGGREALLAALNAFREAAQQVTLRDAGEVIETPAVAPLAKPAQAKPKKLREVYDRWKASKARSADTHNACWRSVLLFEEFTGNTPIAQVTREQGDGFRAWLQHPDRKTTSKTARDRLVWVKSLLKYAFKDLELITRNPWESLDIPFRTTNKRRPWTADELRAFFSQDLYTAHKLPTDKLAGADAAYWIPLLGLYTGARIGELAQLRADDVDTSGPIAMLSITDEGEGQLVKTEAGVRKVPIHSELIRLGFLDYAQSIKDSGEARLWPKLPLRADKPGGFFSRWFGEYRAALGFGKYPDFHCIRHTVRSQLAEADIAEATIDMLIGHEVKGSTGAKVYTHRNTPKLQAAIETLAYPSLSLKRH